MCLQCSKLPTTAAKRSMIGLEALNQVDASHDSLPKRTVPLRIARSFRLRTFSKEQGKRLVEAHNESDTVSRDNPSGQQHAAMVEQTPSTESPAWAPALPSPRLPALSTALRPGSWPRTSKFVAGSFFDRCVHTNLMPGVVPLIWRS